MEEVKGVEQVSPPADDNVQSNPTPAEGQTQEQDVAVEAPTQGQAVEQKQSTQEEVNWKNRAMEYERKLRETVESIPKVIQESISQSKPDKKDPEYTIADLKTFVDTTDNAENKRWAYSEIERLESERIAKTVRELTNQERAVSEAQMLRKQVEQEVVNDPRFSEAFVEVNGTKQWNFNSPLTVAASNYMKDPVLSQRPDGMKIAMKLAYADFVTQSQGAIQAKMENTKSENTKLKQATLADGGGVNNVKPKVNPIAQAQEELAKTGSKTALRTLTQAILKQQGLIQ